jgi:thymidylate synthase
VCSSDLVWHDNESRAIAPTGEWTDWNGRPIANWRSNLKARAAQIARKRPSKALTKPKGVWDAKQGIDALNAKLERLKANPKNRRHKTETPWETEWTPEAKVEVAQIRAKIRELEGVVAA